MHHVLHHINGQVIAEFQANGAIIRDAQQFLEVMMNLPADRIVIHQACIDESFFDLRSGLAGEVLQKVVNYSRQLGIVGDFSIYESKSLRDLIYESNKSNTVVFVQTLADALKRLSA